MEIDELYQEQILEHAKRSAHRGTIVPCERQVNLKNPLCGDEVRVYVEQDAEIIRCVRFEGQGCIISQAAASMVAALVEGKSTQTARGLIENYRALLLNSTQSAGDLGLGELVCLKSVGRFPARIRCALLAAEAVLKAIK